MSVVEKRGGRRGSGGAAGRSGTCAASEALCDSADETDREVSSLTDRAFRSLCIGDEAVYNDTDPSASPLKQPDGQTMPLTTLANQMLPLTSLAWGAEGPEGGWPAADDATMAALAEQQLQQLSYLSNGSMEALWQQRQQSSRVSSLIKAFGGDGYYDNMGAEAWDRAAMLSLQQELSDMSALQAGFAGFPQGFGGFPQGYGPMEGDPASFLWGGGKMKGGGRLLNATNLFLHSEFSPFQAWSSYKRQPSSYPSQTSNDCPPRWYDSPLYKELTAANPPPPPIRAPSHSDARKTQRRQGDDWASAGAHMSSTETYAGTHTLVSDTHAHTLTQKAWSVEKRCESEVAGNGAPWKRLGGVARGKLPTHRPATVSPTSSESFRRPEQLQRLPGPGPAPEDALPSDTTPLPSSNTPFNISQLLTPVLPPRVGTDCSELSMGPPVLGDGEEQQQRERPLVEVRQLRDGYKARASSLLFNLKDNRKRVKNTYSPTRFRTQDADGGDRSSRQPSRLDALQNDAAATHTLQTDTEAHRLDTHTYEDLHSLQADGPGHAQLTDVPSHTVDTLRDVPLHTLETDAAAHALGMDAPVHTGDPTQTLDMDTHAHTLQTEVPEHTYAADTPAQSDVILPAPPLPPPPIIIAPPAPLKLSPPSIEVTMAPSPSPLPPPSETSSFLASAEELPLFSNTEGGRNPILPPISTHPPPPMPSLSPGPPAPLPATSPALMPSSAAPLCVNGTQDYLAALPGGVAPGGVPTHAAGESGLYHMHTHPLPSSAHAHTPTSQSTAARAHADIHTLPDMHMGEPVEHASVSSVTRATHTPTHTQAYPQPHTQPYPQAHTPTHTQAYPQAYTPTYTQAYPQAYTPTQPYPQVQTPTHPQGYPPYPQTQTPSHTQPYPQAQTPTQSYPQAYTPSHTQPYPAHTQAYPQAYTPTHPYPAPYPQAQTPSHTQPYLQVPHTHAHSQGHTPPHSQAYLHPYPPTHTQAYSQPYSAPHTQAYVPTHTQPYAPTHTHAHTLPHVQPYHQADSAGGLCDNSTTVVIEPPEASTDPYNLPHTHAHHTLSPYYYNPTHTPHTHNAYQYGPYTHNTQTHNPYAQNTHSHDMSYYGAPYTPHAYDTHRHDGQHAHDPYAHMGAPPYGEQNTHIDPHGYPSHETAAQHYHAPYTPQVAAEPQSVYAHDNTQVFADTQRTAQETHMQVDTGYTQARTPVDMHRYSPAHTQHTLPDTVNGVSEQANTVVSRETERRAQNVVSNASDPGSSDHDLPKTTYARASDGDMSNTTYPDMAAQRALPHTSNGKIQSAQTALPKGNEESAQAQNLMPKDTARVAKQNVLSKNTSVGSSEKELSKPTYAGMATQSTMSENTAGVSKSDLSNKKMATNERMDAQAAPLQSKSGMDSMDAQTGHSKANDGPAKSKPEQTTPPSQREPSKISPQTLHKGMPLTPFNIRKNIYSPYKDSQQTPEIDTSLTPYNARKQRQFKDLPSMPDKDRILTPYNTRKDMPYKEPLLTPRKDTEWLPYVTRAYGPLKDAIQSETEVTSPSKDPSNQETGQEKVFAQTTGEPFSRTDTVLDSAVPAVAKETERGMRMLEDRRRNGSSRPELKEDQKIAKVIQEDDRKVNRDVIPDYRMKQSNGQIAPDYGTKHNKDKTMVDYTSERPNVEVSPDKKKSDTDRERGGDIDKHTVHSRGQNQESSTGPVVSSSIAQHKAMNQQSEDKSYITTNSQPIKSTDSTNMQPGNKRNSDHTSVVMPTDLQPSSLPTRTNNNLPAKSSLAYTTPTTEKSVKDSHPDHAPTPARSQQPAPSVQPPNNTHGPGDTKAKATQQMISDHSQSVAIKQAAVTSTTKQPRRMTPIMPRKLFLNNVQPAYKPSSSNSQQFSTNNNQRLNSQPTMPSEQEPVNNNQQPVTNKLPDKPTGSKEISSESQETIRSPKPIRAQIFAVGNQPEPMKSTVDVVKLPEPAKSTVDTVIKIPEAIKSKVDDKGDQSETNKLNVADSHIQPEVINSKVKIVGKLSEPIQPKGTMHNKPQEISPEVHSLREVGTDNVPKLVKSKEDNLSEPIKSKEDSINVQPGQMTPKINVVNNQSEPPIKTQSDTQPHPISSKVDRVSILPDSVSQTQSMVSPEAQPPSSNSIFKPNQRQAYATRPTNENQENDEMSTNSNLHHIQEENTISSAKQIQEQYPPLPTKQSEQPNTVLSIHSTNQNPQYAREPMAGGVGEAGRDLSQPVREERFSITDILSIRDKELMRRERLKEIRLGDVTQSTNHSEPEQGPAAQTSVTADKGLSTAEELQQREKEVLRIPETAMRLDVRSPERFEQSGSSRRETEKIPGKVLSTKERAQTKQEMLTSKVKAHAQKEISALKEKGFLSKNTPKALPMATKEKAAESLQAKKEITADKLNYLFKDITRYGDTKEPEAEDNLWQTPLPEVQVLESSAEQVESTGLPVTSPELRPVEQHPTSVEDGHTLRERDTVKPDTYAVEEIDEAKPDKCTLKQVDTKSNKRENTANPSTQVVKERSSPSEKGSAIEKEKGPQTVSPAAKQHSDTKDMSLVKKGEPSDVKENDISKKANNVSDINKATLMLASGHEEADAESTPRQSKTPIQLKPAVTKSSALHVQPESSSVSEESSIPDKPASLSQVAEAGESSKVQQKESDAQLRQASSLPMTAPPQVDHMTPETTRKKDDIITSIVNTDSSSKTVDGDSTEEEGGFFLEIQSICGYAKSPTAWADSGEDTGKGRPGLTVTVIEHGRANDAHKSLTEPSRGEARTKEGSGQKGFTVTVIERERRKDEQDGFPDSSEEAEKTEDKQTQQIENTLEDQNKNQTDDKLDRNQEQQNKLQEEHKQVQNEESENEWQEELKEAKKQEPLRPLKEDQQQEHKKVSEKEQRIKTEDEDTQRAKDNRAFIRKVEEEALAKDNHSFMRKGEAADKDTSNSESTVGMASQIPKMVDKQQPEKMGSDVALANVGQEVTMPSRGDSELSRSTVERTSGMTVKVDERAAKPKEAHTTDTDTHTASLSQMHTTAETMGGRGTGKERQTEITVYSTEPKARAALRYNHTTKASNPDSTSDAPEAKSTVENIRGKSLFTSNDDIQSKTSYVLNNETHRKIKDAPADVKDPTRKAKEENIVKAAANVSAKPQVGGESPKQKTQKTKGTVSGYKGSEDSTQKNLPDASAEPKLKAKATEEDKYSNVASRELLSAIQTQDILDAKVDARVGRRSDNRDASTLAMQREAWRSARGGGQGIERGRGMREGGTRERGQSLDRDVGRRDRRVSVDRERGGRERGVSMDRERSARERGGSVDRDRSARERGMSMERDRPRQRGVSIDKENPARERGQSVDRERGRRENGYRDRERGRPAEREQRTGGTTKARQERETPMDRHRGETEVQFTEPVEDSKSHNPLQSTEKAGRGRPGSRSPSERGNKAPPVVTEENARTTMDSKSRNTMSSAEAQKPSITTKTTVTRPQEDTARKDTKDMRSPEPPQPPTKPKIHSGEQKIHSPEPYQSQIRSPHLQPPVQSPEPPQPPIRSSYSQPQIHSPEPPQPPIRNLHAQIRSSKPSMINPEHTTQPPIRSPQPSAQPSVDSSRAQALSPEKEPSRAVQRQQTRSASRPEISALADYARLRVLPDREDDITTDDTSLPVSLAFRKPHAAVATETPASELTLENFTADKARREAEANMARVMRYREREKHAGSRMPDLRRNTDNHATPATAIATTKDHGKASQHREPIREEDKVSQAEVRLAALAQPPQAKGRRRGASLPREAIRDRSTEREFYPTQRGRPGVPRNIAQGSTVVPLEPGPESQPEETPELESEPLQYYSVSSQEPEPNHTHTKHSHILQPAPERLPAHKHILQPAYDPEGLKHTQGQPGGQGRGNENGFIQDYPAAPMADENILTSDHPAVMMNDRAGNDTTGRDVGVDHGRSKMLVANRSNPTSPAFGKPIMFNVKDNTFRASSVTKAVKPRLHRTSFSDRFDDITTYLPGDRTNPSPSPQPHPIRAFHQQSRDALPPAESPAPRESVGRFRRSLALEDEDARSVVSLLSEDTDAGYYGYGDSESERPESACSFSSQSGRPPPVAPKTDKALRRAKRLTSRRLKKAEAKVVASVPSSPTQVVSAPLQLPRQHHHQQQTQPHAHAQYHLSAGYAPAPGVVSPASFSVSQRKLLQDPSSGQLFMVDVPLPTVKTKTFFDPQTGKYVRLNVRLNVRQPAEAATAVPATPQYMMYPGTTGYLPVPLSSLPTRRSTSQMSAPATLMQEELDMELEAVERPVHSGRLRLQQQQHQQQAREAPASAYKESRGHGIITMSELEDFAMENA